MIFISTPTPAPAPAPSITTKQTVLGSTKSPLSLSHDDPFTVGPSSTPPPNAHLQVFVDPSGLLYKETQRTPKHQFQTSVRVKENIPEAKKAGGTTLKQAGKSKRVASGPVSSKIAVFRNEDRPPPVPVPSKISVQCQNGDIQRWGNAASACTNYCEDTWKTEWWDRAIQRWGQCPFISFNHCYW